MYRSFSELDLEVMKRVRNRDMTGEKFDSQALLATFAGHSLVSIFTGENRLFQAILRSLEDKFPDQTKDADNETEINPVLISFIQILLQRQCIKQ